MSYTLIAKVEPRTSVVIEGETVMGELMKKLGVSYSYRFNHTYDKLGNLFKTDIKVK